MDRGYWDGVLLFCLLDQGADIHGTVKQMDWVPLTFDRKNTSPFPEKPKDITKQGYKDDFYMQTSWRGKTTTHNISCAAYQSDTGTSVSIALSS